MHRLLVLLVLCAACAFADTRPATQPAEARAAAKRLVAKLDNSLITDWHFARAHPTPGNTVGKAELWYFGTYKETGASNIHWDDGVTIDGSQTAISPAVMASALIDALDNPKKFLAAHLALVNLLRAWQHRHAPPDTTTIGPGRLKEGASGSAILTIDGLRVELIPYAEGGYGSDGADQLELPCTAKIDPAQIKTISKQWHDRLPGFLHKMDDLSADAQTPHK